MATLLEQDETPSAASIPKAAIPTTIIDGVIYPLINLTRGYQAIVDWKHYESLSQWKWCAIVSRKTGRCYAVRPVRSNRKNRVVFMHRQILGIEAMGRSVVGDHRDNEHPLDNRESNLRVCTKQQNECNTGLRSNNKSGYKGVSWYKARSQWFAYITVKGRRHSLGYFHVSKKEQAARAYDAAAVKHFGEYARLNFPEEHRGEPSADGY